MNHRRLLGAVAVAALALLMAVVPPATAQTANKTQDIPTSIWDQPGGPELLDGVGSWVYIAPQAPPGPTQGSPDGYEYLLSFSYPGLHIGYIGLATRPEGRFAGLILIDSGQPAATVAFNWSPGQIYYLLVYHLGGDQWGGWVYDYSAGSWTFVGQVTAPAGWGKLTPSSRTLVDQKDPIAAPTCAQYPRTDAYFFPPVGYRGTSFTVASLAFHHVITGECPSQTTLEYGWVHYRLGADPTG